MLLKKKKKKSSTEKQITAIIVHEAKRTATSTRTTHTRDNKPFEAAAVQQRRCPQLLSSLAVSAAVRTWCGGETSTRKTSTSISAYLVSYCLLVRQQQRFHHPTLRTSTVILVACIEQSTISGKHVHCCILVHVSCFFGGVGMFPVIVRTYLVCVASSRVLFC